MHLTTIHRKDNRYPKAFQQYLGDDAPEQITALGNLDLLLQPSLALFCSRQCHGSLILQTYDLAQSLRDAGVTVIGGFHSPMEQECLTILLRGAGPILVCPARSLPKRIPAEWKNPLDQGRLLALTPFADNQRRMTAELAVKRNRFVAALAETVFIAYASPGGKTEEFCCDIVAWGKPVFTHANEKNANLLQTGARSLQDSNVAELVDLLRQ